MANEIVNKIKTPDGTVYDIVGSDPRVSQTNTSADAAYRVLLSSTASDTATTAGAYKSGTFTFNPYNGASVQGIGTLQVGDGAHVEGKNNKATGDRSHAEGDGCTASGSYSHAEGGDTKANGNYSHAEGCGTTAESSNTHAEGYQTSAYGDVSHAEGYQTTSSGFYSHAEGDQCMAARPRSHAEGYQTTAGGVGGDGGHSEGNLTYAFGNYSHAEGGSTTAAGNYAHSECGNTTASGNYSHAEGRYTAATTTYGHSEGYRTTSSGSAAHAEGYYTVASGHYSHADGYYTTANHRSQHVFGEYNVADASTASSSSKGDYIEIVGNGTGSSARSNARTLDWNGNEVLGGTLTTTDVALPSGTWDGVNTSLLTAVQGLYGAAQIWISSGNATTSSWTAYTKSGGASYNTNLFTYSATAQSNKGSITIKKKGIYMVIAKQRYTNSDASVITEFGAWNYTTNGLATNCYTSSKIAGYETAEATTLIEFAANTQIGVGGNTKGKSVTFSLGMVTIIPICLLP